MESETLYLRNLEATVSVYLRPLDNPKLAKKLSVTDEDRAALASNLQPIIELHRVSGCPGAVIMLL